MAGLVSAQAPASAQSASADKPEVTFTKDIAPILQRSCQRCHRPDGGAPMPLITYEQVRPWARSIKTRTGLGPRAGVMPPWFVEKNIGIQDFKHDPSLSEAEIATIAKWADSGAPRGNPADMPTPLDFDTTDKWTIGEPDLILRSPDVVVPATAPDKWGSLGLVPTGLTEDRYVSAVEVREINDIPRGGIDQHRGRPLRVPPHDVFERRAGRGRGRRRSRRRGHELADSRGRPQPRHLPARSGPAAGEEFVAGAERVSSALERPRDEGAARVRVQVLSRRATSRSTAARRCASATASTST